MEDNTNYDSFPYDFLYACSQPMDSIPRAVLSALSSEGSTSASEYQASEVVSTGQKAPRRGKTGNKKAPRHYPADMQGRIQSEDDIWGQRFEEIKPFDPSLGVGHPPQYTVMELITLRSRLVSQAQAFSGRDEEVEEWRTQLLASVHQASPTARPASASPPTGFRNVQPHRRFCRGENVASAGHYPNFFLGVPTWSNNVRHGPRSSPFPSDSGSLETYFPSEDYESGTEPPPSRGSSLYEGTPFSTTPSPAVPEAGPSAHPEAAIYSSHPVNGATFAYGMGPTGIIAPQLTPATPPSCMTWSNGPFFGAPATLQQYPHGLTTDPFAPANDLPAPFFADSGAEGGYYGGGVERHY